VSTTVTVKVLVPMLLCASVAVQVTVVVPRANGEPLAGTQAAVNAPSRLSVADALKLTTAPLALVASALIGPGTVTTGAVWSINVTVTVKLPLAALLCTSVAVHVTAVVPIGNVDPLAGAQTGLTDPSTRSVAVAVNVAIDPAPLVISTVWFTGSVNAGGVVS
jgi:hypothetical protein